ncbi:MAG TPA: 8-amino-7-oxononanoate synthase, partial [Candidatus Binatia bacterium]|nr:8-amino-7-oxononanoate synthase [Candidatus Binatia bacterium]
MGLFDRFEGLRAAHGQIKSCGADPFGVKMDRILSATEAEIEGRHTILCGSNNYLGLTFDAESVAAA